MVVEEVGNRIKSLEVMVVWGSQLGGGKKELMLTVASGSSNGRRMLIGKGGAG